MGFTNAMATATPEQVKAATKTINLAENIEKFIVQSEKTERSNKRLTWFVVGLSFIQTAAAILTLFKK